MLFKFVLFFLLMCFSFKTKALEDISLLGGKEIIFSNPFKSADKAVRLKVQTVALSENFDDDGKLLINGQLYPIDQLFMENQKGKYENLASLLNYFGTASTFFIRYYEPDRLDIQAEKTRLLTELNSCNGAVEAEKTADYGTAVDLRYNFIRPVIEQLEIGQ